MVLDRLLYKVVVMKLVVKGLILHDITTAFTGIKLLTSSIAIQLMYSQRNQDVVKVRVCTRYMYNDYTNTIMLLPNVSLYIQLMVVGVTGRLLNAQRRVMVVSKY